MDDESGDETVVEENYYTFLNVSKTATIDEINSAYRTLSRFYHPDKHCDPGSKKNAELLFNRTVKAYEVLSDPCKRAIYDSLGAKGLKTDGWEIIQRTRTPSEIREEYERLAQEREERRLQQKTNPRGNVTVNVNATDIFSSYQNDYEYQSFFPMIEVSGMSISQSIESPMTARDTTVIGGNLSIHNGTGTGGFLVTFRRLINKGWFALDVGAGNGPVCGLKLSRTLTQRIFCNGGVNINMRSNAVVPGLVGTLAIQLDKHTVGYLTYNAGIQSSLSSVLEHNRENNHVLVTCSIGVPHCYLSATYARKFVQHELKLKLAVKFGTFGYITEYGAEKKVSKYSSVLGSVSIGHPTGVTLKLKLIRSTQSFVFPIHLSEDIIPAAIFYATIAPVITWYVVKKAIIDPINSQKRQRNLEIAKEANKKRMAEKKQEAEAAVELMLAQCDRIRNDEQNRNGLIIENAIYGNLSYLNSSFESGVPTNSYFIDVSVPLQCLIKDSKLIIHESSKSELPGFYDPCVGEEKQLKIDYVYKNQKYSIVISDTEPLRIPFLDST